MCSLIPAVMGTQEPPTPCMVLGVWVTGPGVQISSLVQYLPGGQNSQLCGPPLPWAETRALSLSLAPDEAGEPRRGTKSIIPRHSGLGVGIKHPVGTPAQPPSPSAGTQETARIRGNPTCSSEPFVPPSAMLSLSPQEFSCHPQASPLPGDSNRNHRAGAVLAVWDSVCKWGTGAWRRPSPKKAEVGGVGAAAFPAPSASTLAPAASSSTTDLIRQLQQPAAARCPPGEPPTSGRARGDSSWLAPPPGRWGRPSLPSPGPNYNPSHVPLNAPKSRTQIL